MSIHRQRNSSFSCISIILLSCAICLPSCYCILPCMVSVLHYYCFPFLVGYHLGFVILYFHRHVLVLRGLSYQRLFAPPVSILACLFSFIPVLSRSVISIIVSCLLLTSPTALSRLYFNFLHSFVSYWDRFLSYQY